VGEYQGIDGPKNRHIPNNVFSTRFLHQPANTAPALPTVAVQVFIRWPTVEAQLRGDGDRLTLDRSLSSAGPKAKPEGEGSDLLEDVSNLPWLISSG